MANETVSITQSVNSVTITDINAGVDSFGQLSDTTISSVADNELLQYDASSTKWLNRTLVEAGVAGLAGSNFTGALNVGSNGSGHDVKFFGATSGKYLQWDASADKLILSGDLDISGTTTTLNSDVVTIDDPVFTIGGDTAPSSYDDKDRGIEFRYFRQGEVAKVGFFGFDTSENAFTFLTNSTNNSEAFSGTLGNLKTASITLTAGTLQLDSAYAIQWGNGNNRIFGSSGNNYIRFDTNGAERMKLDSSGRLIITNSAPVVQLIESDATSTFNNTEISLSGGALNLNTRQSDGTFVSTDYQISKNASGATTHKFFIAGTEKMRLDSTGLATFYGTGGGALTIGSHIDLGDSQQVRLGASDDLQLYHDGTHSYISNTQNSGNLIIENGGNDHDIVFRCDDGSGGVTEYFRLDGGASASGFPQTIVPDNASIRFGDGGDLLIYHSGSESEIRNLNGDLRIVNRADDKDIIFQSDDGSGGEETYFYLDGSISSGEPNTVFPDNAHLRFGTGADFGLVHDGYNTYLNNSTGHLYITNNADDKDIVFRSDDGSGGNETYFYLDGSASSGNPITVFPDNSILQIGGDFDLRISHDGTDSTIRNYTGDLIIKNSSDDKDIIFQSDDGSGGTETYFRLDGSASSGNPITNFPDNSFLSFGSSHDFSIYHDSTNTYIANSTNDLYIQNNADDKDIIFRCDNGSGGVAEYFRLDGGEALTIFSYNTRHGDNVVARFGGGNDLNIYHDGSGNNSIIQNETGHLDIKNDSNGSDLRFFCDDGSNGMAEYFRLDGGLVHTIFSKNTQHQDDVYAKFGNAADMQIFHSGGSNIIQATAGDLIIQNTADDKDVIFKSDDGSGGVETYFYLDGSAGSSNPFTVFPDNARLTFGTGYDLRLVHDGTNSYIQNFEGDLQIIQYADDKDIHFQCDDGSGGVTDYLKISGANNDIRAYKNIKLSDNSKAIFGDGSDFQIFHTGTNTTMLDQGTGALVIASNNLRVLSANQSETLFEATEDGAVELYHNNVKKIETTADGIQVTGDILAYTDSGQYFQLDKSDNSLKLSDNVKLKIGTGMDLQIYHDGSHSWIEDTGQGDLYIKGSDDVYIMAGSDIAINCNEDSSVSLWYNNSKKLETTSAGATLTGDLTLGDSHFIGDDSFDNLTLISSSGENIVAASASDIYLKTGASGGGTGTTRVLVTDSGADVTGDLTVSGNLTINGTTTTIDTANLTVEDKNIIIGNVSSPSDTTADGGGITLKGASDYTIQWTNSTDSWHFNQGITVGVDDTGHDVKFFGATSGYYGMWDQAGNRFKVSDSAEYVAGSGNDLKIYHNGTNSYLKNTSGDLYIKSEVTDGDIIFEADNGSGGQTTYIQLDGGGEITRAYKAFRVQDDVKLQAGSSGDLDIKHSSNNSYIENHTGHLYVTNTADDSDITFRTDNGSGGVTKYFQLDGGLADGTNLYTVFPDNSRIRFGDGLDLDIHHDGSNSYISQTGTGNLNIQQTVDDADIIFKCDNGSGGTTQYFRLDGSDQLINVSCSNGMQFNDNVRIKVGSGTGGDLRIYHDGSHSQISNETGSLTFSNSSNDEDILFRCDDGSGGLATYFYLDGSLADGTYLNTRFPDNSRILLGTGGDLVFNHDGTNSYIDNDTGNLYIRAKGDDKDIIFQCDDGSGGIETYFFLDGSASSGNPYTIFPDNSYLAIGSDVGGITLHHDGTNSWIRNYDGDLKIINYADDKDIIFQSDDGSGGVETYFYLDGNRSSGAPFTVFPDESYLVFGDSLDFLIRHNGTDTFLSNDTGDLYIRQDADDKDIVFQSDDGSGGMAQYIRIDGSAGMTQFDKDTKHADTIKATFGNSGDLEIYHGGSSSIIKDNGDGGLYLQTNGPAIYFQDTDGNGMAQFTDGGACFLMYDGSTKFQTSATGATMGGNLVMGGHDIKFADDGRLRLGDSNDLDLWHSGSHSYINNNVGDLHIYNNTDNGMIRFYSDDGTGGVTEYVRVDGSAEQVLYSRDLTLTDGLDANFGTGNDLKIGHDGTNGTVSITDGDLRFIQYADDKDIVLMSDDGSGGVTAYLTMDGSGGYMWASKNLIFADNIQLNLGNGNDLQLYHDGSNSYVTNATGDMYFINSANDKDITFMSDDGSGGFTTYFSLDGSGAPHPRTTFPDNSTLQLGTGGDFQMLNDSADTIFAENTRNFHIRNNANGGKIIFESDDGSTGTTEYFRIDGTSENIQARKDLMVSTGKSIYFNGTSGLRMLHDGSNSIITNESTGNLTIQNSATDKDVVFKCDNGSGATEIYFFLDGSLSGGDPFTVFPDDSYLAFGPDADMTLHHDGTDSKIRNQTGNLVIEQNANDKDIVFKCDDGSGGTTEYFYLDGSAGNILFGKELRLLDGVQIQLGTGNDMQVTHNGAIGTIQNTTGDLQLKTLADDSDMIFYSDDGSGSVAMYLSLDGGREVVKHHRGVEYNTVLSNNSDYTVGSANHVILMHGMNAGRTVTIPTAQCNSGRVLIVKDRDGTAATHNITIATGGSETIDGGATHTMSTNRGSVTLISDGSNWFII